MLNSTCTQCFKSLGVKTKYDIYKQLQRHHKMCVSEVVQKLDLTQPTVSHHLMQMTHAGLIKREQQGKQVFYSINTKCPHEDKVCVLQSIKL